MLFEDSCLVTCIIRTQERLIDLIETCTAESIKNNPWLIATYLPTKTGSSALTNTPISQV